MAVKISGLSVASSLVGTDLMELAQGAVSTKATLTVLQTFVRGAALTDLAAAWTPATTTVAASLILQEATNNGVNKITVKAPDALAADWTMTLPPDDGTPNQVLSTDGNGITTWVTSAAVALVVGTTAISGGTPTHVLYNNAGVLGEYGTSGSGNVAMTTSPVFTTPNLGTPSAAVLTNATGTAAGLTAGTVTTNANLTGPITSVGNATAIASQTGTGTKFVVDTSPTLVTPILGVAAATSINKVAITAPATSATLTLIDGTTLTGPAASGTAMTLGNAEAVSGIKTFATGQIVNGTLRLGTVSTTTGQLLLANSASANLTTIQAGNAAAARTYTWPTNFGAAGTVLTDAGGDGTLSWAAGGGGSPGGSDTQVQFNDGGAFGGDAGLTYNKTTDLLTTVNLTADNLIFNAGTFGQFKFRAAVGGNVQFLFHAGSGGDPFATMNKDYSLRWSDDANAETGTLDTRLYRDGSGVLAQRSTTTPQTFRIYNTFTDASNYEHMKFGWATNIFEIKPENAGTGSARVVHLSGLPTSNPGAGILWNNAGTPAIGT